METIAAFMQNESAVIAVGITALIIGVAGLLVLGAVSFASTFVRRLPGGSLALAGFVTIIAMFAFVSPTGILEPAHDRHIGASR